MTPTKAHNLACPLDGAPLAAEDERHYRCAAGHSFDIARQGYLHLLPVQHKRSREPGDSKAMVDARTRFLEAGHYSAISARVNALAMEYLPGRDELCVMDAGCGEGYYLARLAEALAAAEERATVSLVGLDISKAAILAACRRSREPAWLVASNRNPALLPGSVDLILCMFGFPEYEAFARVLRPDGKVLLVEAGPEHLVELREVIYPEVRRSPPPPLDKALARGFGLVASESLRYSIELDRESIADLLVMTPHLYRATREGKAAAAGLEGIRLTVEVCFRVLGR